MAFVLSHFSRFPFPGIGWVTVRISGKEVTAIASGEGMNTKALPCGDRSSVFLWSPGRSRSASRPNRFEIFVLLNREKRGVGENRLQSRFGLIAKPTKCTSALTQSIVLKDSFLPKIFSEKYWLKKHPTVRGAFDVSG